MEAVDEEAWSLQSTRADSVHLPVAPPILYVSARKCVVLCLATFILEACIQDVDLLEKAISFLFPANSFPVCH